MPQLLLLRHAKSDWNAGIENDHDRPLNKRGRKAARRIGRHLARTGTIPDLVLTSTAVRAVSTVTLAAEAGKWNCEVRQTDRIYEAAPGEILALIRQQVETEVLLLAGHEPTFSALASLLIGGGRLRLPTAGIACIEFAGRQWSDVAPGTGELAWLIVPKQLERAQTASPDL